MADHFLGNEIEGPESGWPEVCVDPMMLERAVAGLRTEGLAVEPEALPLPVLVALRDDLEAHGADEFSRAGVGREVTHQTRPDIRSDRIVWLDADRPATRWLFAWVEQLRLELNRQLFLGLFDYECHYAWYPQGAFYKVHLDAFRGGGNRVVSTVLYLNQDWAPGDGGELVVYKARPADEPFVSDTVLAVVEPRMGTLAVFLSEEMPHEVLPTKRTRYSVAGWYRLNANGGPKVDPPLLNV